MSRLEELRVRREALVLRAAAARDEVAGATAGLGREIAIADGVVAVVGHLRRYRTVAGVAAGAVLVFAPGATLRWMKRALWIAPIAFQGYRLYGILRAQARSADPTA